MIIKLEKETSDDVISSIKEIVNEVENCKVVVNESSEEIIIGIIGDTKSVDVEKIKEYKEVKDICKVDEPYKRASRKFHPENTVIKIDGEEIIGNDKIMLIAGPCSVETEEQIIEIAKRVKESGATFLRGGAFKPRTSPYAFQGLKYEGLELLKKAREATGLKIVTEIMSTDDL